MCKTMSFSITIQHDFPEVIAEIRNEICLAEDVWISCYRTIDHTTTRSVHGKLRVTVDHAESDGNQHIPIGLQGRDGVTCIWANHATYSQLALIVSCESLSIPPTLVSFPTQIISAVQRNGVECMDVAGDWIVTGGKNGKLRLDRWAKSDPTNLDLQHRLGRGHLSDLTSCQFFPSGEVILTTSIDMSARIFSIHPDPHKPNTSQDTPILMLNARSFAAPHGRGVTAAGIIGKGKEIVTACRDGKLRIWNVAESRVVVEESWPDSSSTAVLAVRVAEKRFLDPTGNLLPSPVESRDQNNQFFLVLALSSGVLHFVDLPSLKPITLRKSLPTDQSNSPIETVAVSRSSDLVAWGTRSGTVGVATLNWHLSPTSSCCSSSSVNVEEEEEEAESLSLVPLASWQRTTAAVNSLEFVEDSTALLVAGDDGLPYRISIGTQPVILEEFAGYNCDPVSAIRASSGHRKVFAAGKDGNVLVWNSPASPRLSATKI